MGGTCRDVHYHVVGSAGVGMSAVAQLLAFNGARVTASDRFFDTQEHLPVIDQLRQAGISFRSQDGSAVNASTRAVVVSTAIEPENPDVAAAKRLGIPVVHRAAMLAELAGEGCSVAVSGTSGKSTVTAMTGWILECAGMNPTVVLGAVYGPWIGADRVGNVRFGRQDLWVVEADESDRSLLEFHPDWAVVTNASADHFDLAETLELFGSFMRAARRGVIDGTDAISSHELRDVGTSRRDSRFVIDGVEYRLPMPGRHNIENALTAVRICRALGVSPDTIADGLSRFAGLHRRLEIVGQAHGIVVVDDYAHNPAKIEAAWGTARRMGDRVIGIWRPHGYGPLRKMEKDLQDVFVRGCGQDDSLFLLPVYDAGGSADRSIQSDRLVEHLQAVGIRASYESSEENLISGISADARSGDVILVMGARDPFLPLLARRLLETIQTRIG